MEVKISNALNIDKCTIIEHGDKYSLLHCIFYAKSKSYNLGYINNQHISKDDMIRKVGRELYSGFTKKVYNNLLGGNMSNSSHRFSEAKKSLKSTEVITFGIQEYISDIFEVDIYILYNDNGKMKVDVGKRHHHYYHKGRSSIIVLYEDNKFSSVGAYNNSKFFFLFSADSDIIIELYNMR